MKTLHLALLSLIVLDTTLPGQTVVWTNTSGGNWSTAVNWNPNIVPGQSNAVIINQPGVTVTLTGTTAAGSITLGTNSGSTVTLAPNGQTLQLYGPLTINNSGSFTLNGTLQGESNTVISGTVNWTAGTLAGAITIGPSGTLVINSTGNVGMSASVLTNNGTVLWTNGTFQSGNGLFIYNYGTWNLQSDQTMNDAYGGAGTIFNNYGILRKTGGAGEFVSASTFASGVVFNQIGGEIDAQNGTNGTQIDFQGGGTFSGGYVTTNQSGLTALSAGSFTLSGTVTGTNTWEDAGNLVGKNTIYGALTWVAGNWDSAAVTITANSIAIIFGGTGNNDLEATAVTNNGTVQWVSGTLRGGNGSIFDNNGVFDMQSDQTFNDAFGGTGAVFNNYGTLRKSGGAGEFTAYSLFASGVVFNQLGGEIDAQNGTGTNGTQIAFQGGGAFSGGFVTTNQYGLVVLSAGSFTLNGTVTGTNTWEDAGNLTGQNTIYGGLTWVAGYWDSAAVTITANSTAIIVGGAGNNDLDATAVTNNGTVQWVSGTLRAGNGSIFVNNGVFNLQSDQTFNNAFGGAGALFNNYGTVRKTGGAGEFAGSSTFAGGVVFNQIAGVIDAQNGTGGTQIDFQGGGAFSGGSITTNQFGLTVLSAGNFTLNGTVTGTNTWEDSGSLVGNNSIYGALTWVAGNWDSAAVTIKPAATVIINGGTGNMDMNDTAVTNDGTVLWNSGTIRSGNGSVIVNNGTWNAASDQTMNDTFGGAGGLFNNNGTFLKSGGANTNQTLITSVTFNQLAGQIDVQTGNLNLAGTENFLGGTTAATGTISLTSGSFTINGSTTTSNLVDNGAIMAGVNVIAGGFTWQNGSWSGTTVTVADNGVLTVNTSGNVHTFGACVFTNLGVVNWSQDELQTGNGTYVYNYGIWNAQDDQTMTQNQGGAGTLFYNYGTVRKSAGLTNSQTTFSGVVFDQSAGAVDVQAGNFVFSTGTENLTGGYITNIGAILLASGSFTVNGAITSSNVFDTGATPAGVNVLSGAFTWQSGAWNNVTVTLATNSLLIVNTPSGSHELNSTIFTNNGTVNWSGDTLKTGNTSLVVNNGLWIALDDQTLTQDLGGNSSAFDNYGTFRKTGGTTNGTILTGSLTFNNYGTLDAQTGVISLQDASILATNGTVNFGLNSLTNYGQILLSGAAALTGEATANVNGGYIPAEGSSFAVLSFGSKTGGFTSTNLPFTDAWATNYSATNFVLTVLNSRPVLTAQTNRSIDELTTLTLTNTAIDVDQPPQTLTFSLAQGPEGMTLNSSTGVLTWTPAQTNSPSTNTVTVVVTDNGTPPLSATNTFTVTVIEVNVAPSLPVIGTQTVNELTLLTVTNTATNFNIHSTNIGYGLINPPPGMTINSNGIITWTPAQTNSPSTNTVTTVVTNSNPYDVVNPELTSTNTFTVIVKEVNVAPTLAVISNQTVNVLASLTVTNAASETNIHATTSYYLIAPSGASINTNGIISWTPAQSQGPSTNTFTTLVTNTDIYDTVHPHLSATNSFQVIVYAPSLEPITFRRVNVGQTVSFTCVATDNDSSRTLTFALLEGPPGATLNTNTGAFVWQPPVSSANTTNNCQIQVSANSTPPDSVSQGFQIDVNALSPVILTAIARTATNFSLQVVGEGGPEYILQATKSLTAPNWISLVTNTPGSFPYTFTTTNAATNFEFYRVKLGP